MRVRAAFFILKPYKGYLRRAPPDNACPGFFGKGVFEKPSLEKLSLASCESEPQEAPPFLINLIGDKASFLAAHCCQKSQAFV